MRMRSTAPYVYVDDERVRVRAYFLWRDRTGSRWWDAESNWYEARTRETDAFSKGRLERFPHPDLKKAPSGTYHLVAAYEGEIDAPEERRYLGSKNNRECSVCLGRPPDRTFRKEAHVVPRALGNRSLFTWDECDSCNELLGLHENELARFVEVERAVAGIRLPQGYAKFKPRLGGLPSKIQMTEDRGLEIEIHPQDTTFVMSRAGGGSRLEMPSQSFSPEAVGKAIAKVAWQALPVHLRARHEGIRLWLKDDVQIPRTQVGRFHVPTKERTVGVAVWTLSRNDWVTGAPTMLAILYLPEVALVWTAPDFVTRAHVPTWTPPLPSGSIGQLFDGLPGAKVPRGAFRIAIAGDHYRLEQTPLPMPVDVSLLDGEGMSVTFHATLTTPSRGTYLLEAFEGRLKCGAVTEGGKVIQFDLFPVKAGGLSAGSAATCYQIAEICRKNFTFSIVDSANGTLAFSDDIRRSEDELSRLAAEAKTNGQNDLQDLANSLVNINRRFGTELQFPESILRSQLDEVCALSVAISGSGASIKAMGGEPMEFCVSRVDIPDVSEIRRNNALSIRYDSWQVLGVNVPQVVPAMVSFVDLTEIEEVPGDNEKQFVFRARVGSLVFEFEGASSPFSTD